MRRDLSARTAALGLAALIACTDGSGPGYAWNAEGRWSGDVEGIPLTLTLEEGDHQYAPTNATLTGSGVFTRGEVEEALTVASGLRSTNRVTLRLSGFVEGEGFLDVLLEDGNTEMRGDLTMSGARYAAVLRRRLR